MLKIILTVAFLSISIVLGAYGVWAQETALLTMEDPNVNSIFSDAPSYGVPSSNLDIPSEKLPPSYLSESVRHRETIKNCKKAIESIPEDWRFMRPEVFDLYSEWGKSSYYLEEYDEAILQFNQAEIYGGSTDEPKRSYNLAKTAMLLCMCYVKKGHKEDARNSFRKACEYNHRIKEKIIELAGEFLSRAREEDIKMIYGFVEEDKNRMQEMKDDLIDYLEKEWGNLRCPPINWASLSVAP